MRALRSRAVQSDSEINETKTEELEHAEENVSKKVKRKTLKKRHSDENGQDLDIVQELVVKKKKTKKSKEQENETTTKLLSTSTESHKSENKDKNIATKKKTKKSKKRIAEILDSSTIQANETATKFLNTSTESHKSENKEENIATKKKTKKSKKRIAEILDSSTIQANETATKFLNTSTESQKSENKVKKVAKKKKIRKPREFFAEIQDSSMIQANETATKVLNTSTESHKSENKDKNIATKQKSKKSKKRIAEILDSSTIQANETATKFLNTSTESQKSEKDEIVAKKKKIRKPREFFAEIQDSSMIQANEIATKVLNTSTEFQKSEIKDENIARKKKIKKPKNFFTEIQDSSMIQENETTTEVLSTSTEYHKSGNMDENIATKKKFTKPRDFLRSTILNSPNFDNVITSTAVKPKRPEMRLEDRENVEMEDTSLISLNKSKTAKKQKKRMSKIEDSKELTRRETFNLPRNKSLNDTNDSIVQTINKTKSKRNTSSISIALNKTSNKSLKINSSDKSIKTTKQDRLSTAESTIDSNRDSVSNRRETFCKPPKISKITDSIIAISDSPEISKMENTFNKSNSVELELTSDEEMETDDDSINSSKLEQNKVLLVENTVITISDTPERTTIKQNTFNKLVSPEITSDEDEETNENKQNKSLRMNQSLNCTKTKNNLSGGSFNRSHIDYKTPENICPIPGKIINENIDEFNELSDAGESILEDIIDISDSPDKSNIKQNNLSDNSAKRTITKSERIINTSGDWRVEKSNTNIKDAETNLNSTFEVENKENDSQNSNNINNSRTSIENGINNTLKYENVSLSPKDKTIRKKWLKFPRHSSDAKSVLQQISSPRLQKKMNVQQIMNTPTDLFILHKQTIGPSNLSIQKTNLSVQKTNLPVQKTNLSFKKSSVQTSTRKSPLKSIKKSALKPVTSASSSKKSATKRTALPNFALIHQKAFEKMENLAEYSERKKQRAQELLLNKPGSKRKSSSAIKPKSEENKIKFSRKLFTSESSDAKFNRFGFKTIEHKKPVNIIAKSDNVAIIKPVVKPSVFARSDVVAIANKNKVVTNKRDDRRDAMKGVRTNRRFELLMQMRNK